MADISTINGVAEDNIASWNGTAAANITSVNGDTWTHGLSGSAWVWGYDEYGTAAQGLPGNVGGGQFTYSSPVQIIEALTDNEEWSAIGVGDNAVYFIKNGTLWATGQDYGAFGRGDETLARKESTPVQVGTKADWSSIKASYNAAIGIDTAGKMWAWGQEQRGGLGQGTNAVSLSIPTQIGSATNWVPHKVSSSGGDATLAVNAAGELYGWGDNRSGQLGDGTKTVHSVPVQIGSDTNWAMAEVCGSGATVAIKTDGTLWSWGAAGYGLLGNNTSTPFRSSPVQVGSATNWGRVAAIYHQGFYAVKTDGTLWSWGNNSKGELGHGDKVVRSVPTQVGSETNWVYDEYGYMDGSDKNFQIINQSGELWTVGHNSNFGQLGDGTAVDRSTLVQVGSATDWLRVESGWSGTNYALRTTA